MSDSVTVTVTESLIFKTCARPTMQILVSVAGIIEVSEPHQPNLPECFNTHATERDPLFWVYVKNRDGETQRYGVAHDVEKDDIRALLCKPLFRSNPLKMRKCDGVWLTVKNGFSVVNVDGLFIDKKTRRPRRRSRTRQRR